MVLCACSDRESLGNAPRIDPALTMEYARAQVAIGPRPSGSENARKTAEWIHETAGGNARIDVFSAKTPRGETTFRNVICEFPGKTEKFVIVGAHYDTKDLMFTDSFAGANDGASGVAVLLAMIRVFPEKNPLPFGVRFVFFDGEEAMAEYSDLDGLHGSRHDSRMLADSDRLKRCIAMILLDMVGDRDLAVRFPSDTETHLLTLAERAAREKPFAGRFSSGGSPMLDDHVPYQKLGVPALDIIDFEYGPGNAFWHTPHDTMAHISGDSMAAAGDFAWNLIWKLAEEN